MFTAIEFSSSQDPTGIGKGPEYEYPKSAVEEVAAVVDAPAPGEGQGETEEEKEPEMSDKEIASMNLRERGPC